jgi:hypothetical protein
MKRPERKSGARNPLLYLLCAVLWLIISVGYVVNAVQLSNHSPARILTIVGTALLSAVFAWLWSVTRKVK